ncbi:MAG: RNA polymerase sigma factor [Planctomycetes bacterium]|nr:RNA polymerase sigma factor [Planctomycetota bacterium]
MSGVGAELMARLVDRYARALVLYARQWCETPEDVVQEAFLKLVRQQPVPDSPVAWLFAAVRHGAISAARAAGRRRRREARVAWRGEPWFEVPDGQRLDAAAATAALQELPLEQRETIVARLWGGLSFEEIAQLTGCSVSTAYRRYQAGLEQLRKKLGVRCLESEE